MNKNEQFVKSIYPDAEIQLTIVGRRRICSAAYGYWVGYSCDENCTDPWKNAADHISNDILNKFES
jgi:hypothetical protein